MTESNKTGKKAEDDEKVQAPAETGEKQPETTPDKSVDTASKDDEAKKTDDKSSETEKNTKKSEKSAEKKADEPKIYFVPGYGNIVGVKSQKDAEEKAAKIIADRRK